MTTPVPCTLEARVQAERARRVQERATATRVVAGAARDAADAAVLLQALGLIPYRTDAQEATA